MSKTGFSPSPHLTLVDGDIGQAATAESVARAAIDQFGFHVAAAPPCPVPLPDPDDEPFLAVAGATDSTLVTGNLKHYPPRSRHGVTVQTPRELVDRLRQPPART